MTQREIHHLLWRAGFGPHPNETKHLNGIDRKKIVDQIFSDSDNYQSLSRQPSVVNNFSEFMNMSELQRKEAISISKKNIRVIGVQWLKKMAHDKAQLRERMVLFWHDHFASSAHWDTLVYNQNETLRKHALGNFSTLLKAMCNDAMLLKYLDNHKNNKQHPNENFTRELLELFTLGEGNYTEEDIKEGARAFTGHAFDFNGEYLFKMGIHDYGVKTFMGQSGRFKANDIIDIILEKKQTARFITEKIYRYFVNTTTIDKNRVNQLAEDFYHSNYDISLLLRQIFESDWFYSNENIGSKIKSPIDLLVGLMRQCSIEFKQHDVVIMISKILGQMLFHPPNVAGWPIGQQWIDSSSLLFRMRLADFLFLDQKINIKAKTALNAEEMKMEQIDYDRNEAISYNLQPLLDMAKDGHRSDQLIQLSSYLLQTASIKDNSALQKWITHYNQQPKTLILNLFRLPEYQMC